MINWVTRKFDIILPTSSLALEILNAYEKLAPSVKNKSPMVASIIRIASNYKLPYFSLTPTFSVCPEHGYLSGEHFKCPNCGKDSEVYSRVVGYLRPVQQWNEGKQAEYARRRAFRVEPAATAAPAAVPAPEPATTAA